MPLTGSQLTLHWGYKIGWAKVCHSNDWRMEKGRLAADAAKSDFSQWHEKVWAFAQLIARQEGRAVKVDDLRKGCYMLALGKDKSLTKFENKDLDRVLPVFRLMIDPDDLDAVQKHLAFQAHDAAKKERERCKRMGIPDEAPELPDDPGERLRLVNSIKARAPEAFILKISKERFHTIYWEEMEMADMRRLNWMINERRGRYYAPVKRQPDPENCPF